MRQLQTYTKGCKYQDRAECYIVLTKSEDGEVVLSSSDNIKLKYHSSFPQKLSRVFILITVFLYFLALMLIIISTINNITIIIYINVKFRELHKATPLAPGTVVRVFSCSTPATTPASPYSMFFLWSIFPCSNVVVLQVLSVSGICPPISYMGYITRLYRDLVYPTT